MNVAPDEAACAPGLRARVGVLIEDVRFEKVIAALVVANAITLGLETSPAVVARIGDWLHVIDRTVLGVFVVELLSRSSSMRCSRRLPRT